MATPKTIVLKGKGIRKEFAAAAAITPGHLLEMASATTVKVHATAGGNANHMFAVEDDLQGKTISNAYASAARVQCEVLERGAEVYALLADGQNVSAGDFLESAGDGTLQKHTADVSSDANTTNQIIAIALEAVDMSGSSGADPSGRIKVELV